MSAAAGRHRRLLATLAVMAGLAVQSAEVQADPRCQVDGLGNSVCLDLAAAPAARRLGRQGTFPAGPLRGTMVMPSVRTDAFGVTRPVRQGVTETRPFGEPPRPSAPALVCSRDAFGNTYCR